MNLEVYKVAVEKLLNEKLYKGAYKEVKVINPALGGKSLKISFAGSKSPVSAGNPNLNGYPQQVSLILGDGSEYPSYIQPQTYGGIGGQSIYLNPNLEDPKEKYLAMKSVRVPFRKPKDTSLENVLKVTSKFVDNWLKVMRENKDRLRYDNLVNYRDLLKVEVKPEKKEKVMPAKKLVKKTPAKAPAKAQAKTPAKRTRKAPVKKATDKAPAKATRTRMSTGQKLSSKHEPTKLAGALELASACLRKGKSKSEQKAISNKVGSVRTALMSGKGIDSKKVKIFVAKIRANNQRLYKALVGCTRNAEVEKFYKDITTEFKGESKAKGLPELF